MPAPDFQPRQHPELITLLQRVLERLHAELPRALGVAVTVQDKRFGETPSALAALGVEAEMVAAQLSGLGGPVADALNYQVPVLSVDLFSDERWPDLTRDAAARCAPAIASSLPEVCGVAAVAGFWRTDAAIMLSCTLREPGSASTVATLIAYEQLVSAALVTTAAQNEAAFEDLLTALQSRGAIEQAKGALIGAIGCDADQAWSVLRRASQEFNVKLRELAVALVEHISGRPAEQPGAAEPIAPDGPARDAARLLWTAMVKERPSA
ncbi:ANTAR domain-containing protein [Mycolicibacterium flavescens]|uniref:Antitermination regulator n=1 Tax=Mycolicibacterium flavescens TaxID=1776 RepID=A0A1E3R9G7_MYCFV|nr:ANTAR domain-containing protein [Mycolicibacterium flavescens]MCV7282051.1 ANTAR domain-containing protein [Mycolicibacterium flavescens]ODQ86459.1 antitermination regulator [Mycolicibacterium flavescens]